jgi:formiminotetrahydrofolate cyclodeaminase
MGQASQRAAQKSAPMETLDGYLEALASARPTPGGGSAAAVAGALGAALVAMVARITEANPKFAARASEAAALARHADELRATLLRARGDDESAFAAVVAAQALPRTSDDAKAARTAALQRALAGASEAPLQTARIALDVLRAGRAALELENRNLGSDAGCAAEFAAAALAAAAYNVRANHPYMQDAAQVARQDAELTAIGAEGDGLLAAVRDALEEAHQ